MKDKLLKIVIIFLRKNEFESKLLRKIFKSRYNIDVGMYSYGGFDKSRISSGTIIGRYCSLAPTCYIFGRNHGIKYVLTHPYLYNSSLGVIQEDTISYTGCVIEDDVWIGHNAIILPSVNRIGRGAIIGAGSVVTKNVEAYSIVGGNPAKLIQYRFDNDKIAKLEEMKYWQLTKLELKEILVKRSKDLYNV